MPREQFSYNPAKMDDKRTLNPQEKDGLIDKIASDNTPSRSGVARIKETVAGRIKPLPTSQEVNFDTLITRPKVKSALTGLRETLQPGVTEIQQKSARMEKLKTGVRETGAKFTERQARREATASSITDRLANEEASLDKLVDIADQRLANRDLRQTNTVKVQTGQRPAVEIPYRRETSTSQREIVTDAKGPVLIHHIPTQREPVRVRPGQKPAEEINATVIPNRRETPKSQEKEIKNALYFLKNLLTLRDSLKNIKIGGVWGIGGTKLEQYLNGAPNINPQSSERELRNFLKNNPLAGLDLADARRLQETVRIKNKPQDYTIIESYVGHLEEYKGALGKLDLSNINTLVPITLDAKFEEEKKPQAQSSGWFKKIGLALGLAGAAGGVGGGISNEDRVPNNANRPSAQHQELNTKQLADLTARQDQSIDESLLDQWSKPASAKTPTINIKPSPAKYKTDLTGRSEMPKPTTRFTDRGSADIPDLSETIRANRVERY